MKLTKVTRHKNPDRVSRKVLLDTDKLKSLHERKESIINTLNRISRISKRIVDLFG
jgi:hypothetical protein